ncbi:SDR family NAD(P)-dependent oxidoreductase [Agarilytica rhodophyticola]|uniref:SDR family NAD(P)-dependent oxidoreductase n=1 Tax=Agarilytica rhodophyticola TaxID=1737490 RepID=UPI0013156E73|nr:SDR family oxidoreductase [Agarilytica rhodophyticola]
MNKTTSKVLITGGASGIGKAIVRELFSEGYDIVFTHNRSSEEAQTLLAELANTGNNQISAHQVDLSDLSQINNFLASIESHRFSGFIHNAGMTYDQVVALLDADHITQLMNVNLISFMLITKTIIRNMSRQKAGSIVAIGSITSDTPNQGNAVYASSKAGLEAFVKSLVAEYGRKGLRANIIKPGYIETAMLKKFDQYKKTICHNIPQKRYGQPEEIAQIASFLISEKSSYISGASITADGGLSACLQHR